MPLKRGEVEAALERKGFERREGDHSQFRYHTESGQLTRVRTMTSHGRRGAEIRDSVASLMARPRQCRLSMRQFRRLVDCSLSRGAYERELVAGGVLQHGDLAQDDGN